ncbi:metallophosphoesterase [Micromonospora gifhornensis]|uniref:Serine/threonine protein phosphatase n=1 Tax=Micromonospora gifhornensis TaxID=84594 RepID=A0ABQ4IJL9_9ACTN|nr:metallophosphoesterase [Micromonospora gifhornensis]GIJ18036.1 serine/threonine protein phosphatase [Micromonospora gifhornensis]
MTDPTAPLYAAADIHGHRTEFGRALVEAGLVDSTGGWCGGRARLWLLGDYVDRGPDGIGVIEDIWTLAAEAAAAGGEVRCLLGNHEVQLLAAHHFGTTLVVGLDEPGGFRSGWARFGGCGEDLRRLTDEHLAWMSALPAVAVVDGILLVHSDSVRYLERGSDVAAVNTSVRTALQTRDTNVWLELAFQMSDRGAFRGANPAEVEAAVFTMLDRLGGTEIVHGHSTLTKHFGIAPEDITGPLRYADGRVSAVDGGVYEGGRIIVTRLR